MIEVTCTGSSFENNGTMFGECLKLFHYCGPVEGWMVAMNGLVIAINVVSVVVTTVANSAFLITYFRTRNLRTPHYFLLMLLAITDISVGMVTQPLFIVRKISEIYSIHNCPLWAAVRTSMYYFSGISFLTVTMVTIERYLAVCRPVKHRNKVTMKRVAIVAFTVWAVSLAIPVVSFAFSELYKLFILLMGALILFLVVLNAYLYNKIRQKVSGKMSSTNTQQITDLHKKEARLAKTVACLVVVMILAYIPTVARSVYKGVAGVNTTYLFAFQPFADTLILLNSSFNPLFYCIRNVVIREAIFKGINGTKSSVKSSSATQE